MTTVAPSHDSNLQKRASEEVSIEQERELLLNEKREEMKRVLDSHDDLVRLKFIPPSPCTDTVQFTSISAWY